MSMVSWLARFRHERNWWIDEKRLAGYRDQIAEIEGKIEKLKARQAQRHASRPRKPTKKAAPAPVRKSSGGPAYGNGNAKKARKTKEYKDDEDDEITELTPSQKEDLANKIQAADATILNKALEIIARSQDVASVSAHVVWWWERCWSFQDGEIELDIEALPRDALLELYALVVGPIKKGRKSNYVPNGRKPGRKPGGPRKSMNEEEEVLRIARMEEQLQSFNRDPGASAQAATGYEDNDSESSEDEDSDLD
jgi:bromodomain-containing factor 1